MAVSADPRDDVLPTAASDTGTPRILVVDDEDSIRLVLTRFLRTRGFDVASAESGDAALEMLASERFDLMLCDVRMPGRSGVEIAPMALELAPDLGIVMLSAVNDAPTATEAITHGVLDYLTKPVELGALHSAVIRALTKRAQPRGSPPPGATRASDRGAAASALRSLREAMEEKEEYLRRHTARVNALLATIGNYVEPAK